MVGKRRQVEERKEVAAAPKEVEQRQRRLSEPIKDGRPTRRHFVKIVALVVSRGLHWWARLFHTHCCPARTSPAVAAAAVFARLRDFSTPGAALGPRGLLASLGGRRERADVRLSAGVARASLHGAGCPFADRGKWAAARMSS